MDITAEYKYVYDPEHSSKPVGMWSRTNSGWSQSDGEKPAHKNVVQSKPSEKQAPAKEAPAEKPMEKPVAEAPVPKKEAKPAEKTDVVQDSPSEKDEESLFDDAEETNEPVKEERVDEQDAPADGAAGEEKEQDEEGESLFDGDGSDDEFVTDEDGKEEEQQEIESENPSAEEDTDGGLFDEANKEKYLDPDRYDEYMEQMNSFIEKFDEGEGKENDVTFKAIASNLDWDSTEEVQAFADHCAKKNIDGAGDILAFLYFQHKDDGEKFDKIVEDMK